MDHLSRSLIDLTNFSVVEATEWWTCLRTLKEANSSRMEKKRWRESERERRLKATKTKKKKAEKYPMLNIELISTEIAYETPLIEYVHTQATITISGRSYSQMANGHQLQWTNPILIVSGNVIVVEKWLIMVQATFLQWKLSRNLQFYV